MMPEAAQNTGMVRLKNKYQTGRTRAINALETPKEKLK
jgi:hypothetical protein